MDVRVLRVVLHAARLAAHVHQADRQTARGGRLQGAGTLQRTHVVDQPGAETRRFAHHRRCRGIHGNHHVQLAGNRLDGRADPLQLLDLGDRWRTGAGRLAADVDQRGAGTHHGFGMAQRGITLIEAPTVGEGVGSNVEDAHHLRTGQIERPTAAGQPVEQVRKAHRELSAPRPGRRSASRRARHALRAGRRPNPKHRCRSRSSPWARAARGPP